MRNEQEGRRDRRKVKSDVKKSESVKEEGKEAEELVSV